MGKHVRNVGGNDAVDRAMLSQEKKWNVEHVSVFQSNKVEEDSRYIEA
jgi:hypothetical protein